MLETIFGFFTKYAQSAKMNISMWNWLSNLFSWSPTSYELLEEAERKILSHLKTPYSLKFVYIPGIRKDDKRLKIRTLTMNDENCIRTPLVLLHGLGSAVGLWVLNLDAFARQGPVYAIDVLGFGMSSRPKLSSRADEVEDQLVESIENWRKEMNLEKFILLGHSMGGYLAASYAMKYPDKVRHLILADPWGFPERDKTTMRIRLPFWARAVASVMSYFNPFAPLRVAGPWGPKLLKFRSDIIQKFSPLVHDTSDVSNYIYHCNTQTPAGETAFKTMSDGFGWAKLPMISRIVNLPETLPITFIYGSRSWVDCHTGYHIKSMLPNSHVEIKVIPGSGHHVYGDRSDLFNSLVLEACQQVNDFTLKQCENDEEGGENGEPTKMASLKEVLEVRLL